MLGMSNFWMLASYIAAPTDTLVPSMSLSDATRKVPDTVCIWPRGLHSITILRPGWCIWAAIALTRLADSPLVHAIEGAQKECTGTEGLP